MKKAVSKVPMRRAGKPDEMGDLIAFLASERAGYITGTNVQLDGGLLQNTI
jgi:3-oxoacyl-[acyl-carrier protein] reductase